MLAIIAIVVMAGAATHITKQRQDKGAEKVRQEEKVATLPEKSEIDTSDWTVYRNKKYGFEVRFPSQGWTFKTEEVSGGAIYIEHASGAANFSIQFGAGPYSELFNQGKGKISSFNGRAARIIEETWPPQPGDPSSPPYYVYAMTIDDLRGLDGWEEGNFISYKVRLDRLDDAETLQTVKAIFSTLKLLKRGGS